MDNENLKQRILEAVKPDLEQIEIALRDHLNPWLDVVRQIASHILFGTGKRLRPLLMVLSARLCGYNGTYDKTFSVIFEYLHAATLLHDDLVDGAALRRGKPVAYQVWGNAAAVLTGDFLLARSLSIAAETQRPKIIKIIAEITENMSQGEIHQMMNKGDIRLSEAQYLEIIRSKTAVLMQGACRSGAILADAPDDQEAALSAYGHHVGMAFQIADDLLDYTSDTNILGKSVGADLKEGKLTLPVIHALQHATPPDRLWMESIIQNPSFSDDEFARFSTMLTHYGSLAYAQSVAEKFISDAKAALSIFKPSKSGETLAHLADYALSRRM